MVSWADRIAYVCHDFEDAVSAGVVVADDLPPLVRDRCGTTRGSQLRAFIDGVVDATLASGRVGMAPDLADALAAFRACNYERIYLRPASVEQAAAVQRLLGALVEHVAAAPGLLPAASAEAAGEACSGVGRGRAGRGHLRRRHDGPLRRHPRGALARVGPGGLVVSAT